MEKKRPQLCIYEKYKKKTLIGKSNRIVKIADQPLIKTVGRLKGRNDTSI